MPPSNYLMATLSAVPNIYDESFAAYIPELI
jgi:hypothetical protein